MICRETIWKDGDVSMVEVLPLSGENLPISFSRFRFRMSMQHVVEGGAIQVACDVPIQAENVVDAMAKARIIHPLKEKELTAQLTSKLESMWRDKVNGTATTHPIDIPKIEEEQGPSER